MRSSLLVVSRRALLKRSSITARLLRPTVLVLSSLAAFKPAQSSELFPTLLPTVRSLSTSASVCTSNMTAASQYPLLEYTSLPRFDEIKEEDYIPAMDFAINDFKEKLDVFDEEVKATAEPSYELLMEKLDRDSLALEAGWGLIKHLLCVKSSDALREVETAKQPDMVAIRQKVGQLRSVYDNLLKLKDSSERWNQLTTVQQRLVEKSLLSHRHAGIAFEGEEKEKFNEMNQRLAAKTSTFRNNVLDSTKAWSKTITDRAEIEGLPTSALELTAAEAVSRGHADATAESGPWVLTLSAPCYVPVMSYAKNAALREEIMKAYISVASSGEYSNVEVVEEILSLKKEIAQMLGYENYAEMSLVSKMAGNVDSVKDMLSLMVSRASPAQDRDLEEIVAYAKEQGHEGDLKRWDLSYYSKKLQEERYAYTSEELRQYFPLPLVLDGLFALIKRLFGVSIVEKKGETSVWHPDVSFYAVVDDNTGETIAHFYLDPYARNGEKKSGAWLNPFRSKNASLNFIPAAYIICNGSPPLNGKPSLMDFNSVLTLFHEFGHALQHMLTTVGDSGAAGISGIEWDAVELPSQFMENWCDDWDTIRSFARHWETNEPIPEELFSKVLRAKNYCSGINFMRQLLFATFDLELYSNYNPEEENAMQLYKRLSYSMAPIPPLEEDAFPCQFSHIFAGGYSAGYYSYKWAEVMSADAFAAFEEVGLSNNEEIQATGRRFRNTVLALGGGTHPSEVFRMFRGRDPTPDALMRHSGL